MRIEYKGYVIRTSTGHGKAVKGAKKTESIQVFQNGSNIMLKHYSYPVHNLDKMKKAIEKARRDIDKTIEQYGS